MLSLYKNTIVTTASKDTVRVRKMELDWYTKNFMTLATQATVIAGFSFQQLTTSIPKDTGVLATLTYLALTTTALTFQLYVVTICTFSGIWAPGLALRGSDGFKSVAVALDAFNRYQGCVLRCFMFGLICFVLSSFMVVWIYDESRRSALIANGIMLIFLVTLLVYSAYLYYRFYYSKYQASTLQALEQSYNQVGDLDAMATRIPKPEEQAETFVDFD